MRLNSRRHAAAAGTARRRHLSGCFCHGCLSLLPVFRRLGQERYSWCSSPLSHRPSSLLTELVVDYGYDAVEFFVGLDLLMARYGQLGVGELPADEHFERVMFWARVPLRSDLDLIPKLVLEEGLQRNGELVACRGALVAVLDQHAQLAIRVLMAVAVAVAVVASFVASPTAAVAAAAAVTLGMRLFMAVAVAMVVRRHLVVVAVLLASGSGSLVAAVSAALAAAHFARVQTRRLGDIGVVHKLTTGRFSLNKTRERAGDKHTNYR